MRFSALSAGLRVRVLIDDGSNLSLIDSAVFTPQTIAAMGLSSQRSTVSFATVAGRGAAGLVVYDVPLRCCGVTRVIPVAYTADLSSLGVDALAGKDSLDAWDSTIRCRRGSVLFPSGEAWSASAFAGRWRSVGAVVDLSADGLPLLAPVDAHPIDADGDDRSLNVASYAQAMRWLADGGEVLDISSITPVAEAGADPPRGSSFPRGAQVAAVDSNPRAQSDACLDDMLRGMEPRMAEIVDRHRACLFLKTEVPVFDDATNTVPKEFWHKIDIAREDERSLRKSRLFHMSPAEMSELESQVRYLMSKNFIRPSRQPWSSACFFVRKKWDGTFQPDGTRTPQALRCVFDFRRPNAVTRVDGLASLRADQLFDRLSGHDWFTSIDVCQGWHLIPIEEQSRKYTAFTTHVGNFEFNVGAFGLADLPQSFQRFLAMHLLGDLPFVICYVDDLCIFSTSYEEHLEHVDTVLQRLRDAGVPVSLSKSYFGQREVQMLGCFVSKDGRRADPEKIAPVIDMPPPTSFKALRRYLGSAGYFAPFINGFMTMTAPLQAIKSKDKRHRFQDHWTPDCTAAFAATNLALASPPVLRHPDFTRRFYVIPDASLRATGAVLAQMYAGVLHPIEFRSKIHSPGAYAQGPFHLEFNSFVDAVRHWRPYLADSTFTVLSDHKPLKFIHTTDKLQPSICNALDYLAQFRFEWEWLEGAKMDTMLSDILSRPDNVPVPRDAGSDRVTAEGDIIARDYTDYSLALDSGVYALQSTVPVGRYTATMQAFRDSGAPADSDVGWGACVPPHRPVPAVGSVNAVVPGLSETEIIAGYPTDDRIATIRANMGTPAHPFHAQFSLTAAGLLVRRWPDGSERIVVPGSVLPRLLQVHHDPVSESHPGADAMYMRLRRRFWSPHNLMTAIRKYVRSCRLCRTSKPLRRSNEPPPQLMAHSSTPTVTDTVCTDHVDLPPAQFRNHMVNNVQVWVDDATGFAIFAECAKTLTAVECGELYYYRAYTTFGYPRRLVSDRGSLFTSAFYQELHRLLGTSQAICTTGRPQTDGRSENRIQYLVIALRVYSNYTTDLWPLHLPAVAFALNSRPGASRGGRSPYELFFGFVPRSPASLLSLDAPVTSATEVATARLLAAARASDAADAAAFLTVCRDDRPALPAVAVGNYVLIRKEAYHVPGDEQRKATKLDKLMHGPFKVVAQPGPVTYRLKLPATSKIHPVLNRAMIDPYIGPVPVAIPDTEHGVEVWDVSAVLDDKVTTAARRHARRWLVQWSDGPSSRSWQRRDDFVDPVTGDINGCLVAYEAHRLLFRHGLPMADSLRADWSVPVGPVGVVVTHNDGFRSVTAAPDDTPESVAAHVNLPGVTGDVIVEMNCFRLSASASARKPHHTGDARHGLHVGSRLRKNTVLRLPRDPAVPVPKAAPAVAPSPADRPAS